MKLPTLYVLRHGETEWNVQKRMQGALDSPLTATGMSQARTQRQILERVLTGPVNWITSPLGRAIQTARIVKGEASAVLTTDDRLREIELGEWTGMTREDIILERPDLLGLSFYDAAPGGEGIAAVTTRIRQLLAEIDAPSVLITHGITSRILRCLATGRDPSEFDEIGGGQGIVYRIKDAQQEMLQ